jgi:hypothetical protein
MSKTNETAGKTARHGARCAAQSKTTPKRITLTIDGERYAVLERVAEALNGIPWCENDNTPESVFREWVWPFADGPMRDPRELCGLVEGSFETGFPDGTPEDMARLAEVRAAFEAAGLYGEGASAACERTGAKRPKNGHRSVCA